MFRYGCLALAMLATCTYAALPLPSYVKPCARDDPNINACTMEHARAAIPFVVKGDRKYGIPVLEPTEVSRMEFNTGPLKLVAKNAKVYGYKDADLKDAKVDMKANTQKYEIFFPVLKILGDYEMDGRVLLLPITGNGKFNVTMDNVSTTSEFNLEIVEKEGQKYLHNKNTVFSLVPKKVHFHFTNLFNGDKLLGEEMNTLLNKEWTDAYKELSPPVIQAAKTIIDSIVTNFLDRVPVDVMYPEKV